METSDEFCCKDVLYANSRPLSEEKLLSSILVAIAVVNAWNSPFRPPNVYKASSSSLTIVKASRIQVEISLILER